MYDVGVITFVRSDIAHQCKEIPIKMGEFTPEVGIRPLERSVGRVLVVAIQIKKRRALFFSNIYAPNTGKPERKDFYAKLSECLKPFKKNIIIGGDFNATVDAIDRKVGTIYKRDEDLAKMMDTLNLTDVFRHHNPGVRKYTFKSTSRIDGFLTGVRNIEKMLITSSIAKSMISDHKPIWLDIEKLHMKALPKVQVKLPNARMYVPTKAKKLDWQNYKDKIEKELGSGRTLMEAIAEATNVLPKEPVNQKSRNHPFLHQKEVRELRKKKIDSNKIVKQINRAIKKGFTHMNVINHKRMIKKIAGSFPHIDQSNTLPALLVIFLEEQKKAKEYMEKMIYRLEREKNKIIADSQAGFRRNMSTLHQVTMLTNIIKEYKNKKTPVYIQYYDVKKAYDSIEHWMLIGVLEHYGIPQKMRAVIDKMLKSSTTTIRVNEKTTEQIEVKRGARQGVSPLAYSI